MILNARIGKEIVVVAENRIGILAAVSKTLADHGINIIALSAQAPGGVALVNMVADDHLRASEALRKAGFSLRVNNVVVLDVEDKPGVLLTITKRLAAKKIDILNIYGSAPNSFSACLLVLSTNQNQKAVVALKK